MDQAYQNVMKYYPLVKAFMRDSVVRNFNETNVKLAKNEEMVLGNTGMSMKDIEQYLLMEVVVALKKYNPNYITKEGKSVQEMSFVHTHLSNRVGSLMKRLTKTRNGYGFWKVNIDELLTGKRANGDD